MKKTSAIYFTLVAFIIGSLIGALLLYFFVHIPETEKIENNNKETILALTKNIEDLKKINEKLNIYQLERAKRLKNFIDEIKNKDYSNLTKEVLLSKDIINNDGYRKILLLPAISNKKEGDIPQDDPEIKNLKTVFDDKIDEMIKVASFILKEKVNKLNMQIMDKNQSLSKINSDLDKKNLELEENIKQINNYKDKLESQNEKLNQNLQEINKYKLMLEEHQKQIDALRAVEDELNKEVSQLETKLEDGKLKVSFKGDILFASGSHTLKENGKKLIDSVLPILKKNISKNNIFIAGHTDNKKIMKSKRAKYDSNWDLSTYRAIEVVKYLTAKGISPENITAAGFGEFRPIADNSNEAGRKKNRRVELFLIPQIIKRKDGK